MSITTPDFQADEFLLDHYVGKTPLVRLQRLANHTQATVLAKLEGNNPAGSVKDRPAYNMIMQAEKRGQIQPGDTLIEATSGNTGIALAMVAAMRGYHMKLIMPASSSQERKDAMAAYGAELIEASGMEEARDMAQQIISPRVQRFGSKLAVKLPILSALWVPQVPLWVFQNI